MTATLVVVDPNGRRTSMDISPFPFLMGRGPDNHLVLRDSRVSRTHARIVQTNGACVLEDAGSRHGVWVNGIRLDGPRNLVGGDRIEFGVADGYQVHFVMETGHLQSLLDRPIAAPLPQNLQPVSRPAAAAEGTENLEKLRAVLEVARSLQSSYSIEDVLNTVVDAALAVTSAERGFLLLFDDDHELNVRSARARGGVTLTGDDLRVPRKLIRHALESRRDLFTMQFDPTALDERAPNNTIAMLELRSVCCVPLLRVNLGGGEKTQIIGGIQSSAGVLYMDSRFSHVDLAGGNRELLQTLAIEVSTVLENARLLQQQRNQQKVEEELEVARRIQQSLLPKSLPETGWFRASGSSLASHEVGGDYYDVLAPSPDMRAFVVADVSGKGVSSALLASFLQGVFVGAAGGGDIADALAHINAFLTERSDHGKYATVFLAQMRDNGEMIWANAGHCSPLLVRAGGAMESLHTTSMPVGMVPGISFAVEQLRLKAGDKLILYSDGVTEAQDAAGEFFGKKRLREAVQAAGSETGCARIHDAVQEALRKFTGGAEQSDDVTLVVLEYAGL